MKYWARAILAALVVALVGTLPLCSRFGQLIGKGEFVTYEARDRSRLRAEDYALYELIPSQATDVRIWSFRFSGCWGGRYRIQKSLLEAWVKEKQLSPYQGVAIMEMYYSNTSHKTINTSNGVVYRASEWNGQMLRRDFLLYYDNTEEAAYFNLSIE